MAKRGSVDEGLPSKKRPKSSEEHHCPNVSRYTSWTSEEVLEFFSLRAPPEVADRYRSRGKLKSLLKRIFGVTPAVEGKHLDQLTEEKIIFGVTIAGDEYEDAKKILKIIKSLQRQQYTICNDPIHGPIMLHPLIVKIVNTPEFQRLRNIKQLGGTCYVYPGATHTRFEHSLGVCHLAGELAKNLQANQPELGITDEDVLCVQIAGLCHDLGHGPFSHMFEKYVARKLQQPDEEWKFKHESISKMLFDAIHERNKKDFERYGLQKTTESDVDHILFIREQLEGKNYCKGVENIQGRKKKHFLYEIVANKRNGIDVDKWDYFARDCYYLGVNNDFQWSRCLKLARVAAPEDEPNDLQICMRDKDIGHMYSMFHTRGILHQRAYQHKTTRVVEHMITEAMVLSADAKLLHVPNPDNPSQQESLSLREALYNLKKGDTRGFLQLTDQYIGLIMCAKYSDHPKEVAENLQEAQKFLQRIENRQLCHFVGHAVVLPAQKGQVGMLEGLDIEKEIASLGENIQCYVEVVTISYASEKKPTGTDISQKTSEDIGNPLNDARFYSKMDPWKAIKINQESVSQLMVPREFIETQVRVYDKNPDSHDFEKLQEAFKKWLEQKEEIFGRNSAVFSTPYAAANRPPELAPPRSPKCKRYLFRSRSASLQSDSGLPDQP